MSYQNNLNQLNDRRIAASDAFKENMTRAEMIRNKWNDSVREYRATQARAMQARLASLISREPRVA